MKTRAAVRIIMVILVRPSLWGVALRQARVLVEPRWWARPPRLPVPDGDYMRFRLLTAYGDPDHVPEPADVVSYLVWCRQWRAVVPSGRSER